MAQAALASIPQTYSVQEATAQIVALINSSPRSPRPEAIEAIVARIVASPDPDDAPQPSPMADDWWRALAAERALFARHSQEHQQRKASEKALERIDSEADAAMDKTSQATHRVWRAGAKTWADVVLFAEIARYWMWDPEDPDLDAQYNGWLEIDDTGLDTQALAQLVKAVLTVGKGVRS
jgi:hypothetical protein